MAEEGETEISEETLVDAIRKVSKALQALAASGLNRRAIVTLIHGKSKISKKNIELVLNNLEALEENYTLNPPE